MAKAVREIEREIRVLSPEERVELMRALIAELDAPPTPMSSVRGWKHRSVVIES